MNKPKSTDPDIDRSAYIPENLSSTNNTFGTPNFLLENIEKVFENLSISAGVNKNQEINASQHDDTATPLDKGFKKIQMKLLSGMTKRLNKALLKQLIN